MFVYNVSTKVSLHILNDWLPWQKEEHIPEILQTGLFSRFEFYQLLEQDDEEGNTYILQLYTVTEENYHRYIREFAEGLREKANKKWGYDIINFKTLMKVV